LAFIHGMRVDKISRNLEAGQLLGDVHVSSSQ
jgi:hypothetical protein